MNMKDMRELFAIAIMWLCVFGVTTAFGDNTHGTNQPPTHAHGDTGDTEFVQTPKQACSAMPDEDTCLTYSESDAPKGCMWDGTAAPACFPNE